MTGWSLLLSLLPDAYGIGNYTHSPRFRDWKPSEDRSVTVADYESFVREVLEMCLERLATEPQLWPDIISGPLDDLPAELRANTYEQLEGVEASSETRLAIWTSLDKLWRRHQEHSDTDWAVPSAEVSRLREISKRFESMDPLERSLWLFAGDYPDLGSRKRSADYEAELAELQDEALRKVWDSGGLEAVLSLGERSGSPFDVGRSLASIDLVTDDREIALLAEGDKWAIQVARAYLYRRFYADAEALSSLVDQLEGFPQSQARALLTMEDLPTAWATVDRLAGETEVIYWREFYPYGRGADFPLANETAERLAGHGRPALGLDVLSHFRNGPLPIRTELVVSLFDQLLRDGDDELRVLSRYEITGLLSYLRDSNDVSPDVLARLEWQLIPALGTDPSSSTLQTLLATTPSFFVEVLSLVYRAEAEQESEPTEQRRQNAANAWRLLHNWKLVPGSTINDANIDASTLKTWIETARTLLKEVDREEIGELQIGQILAQSSADPDGVWPRAVIRDVLEYNSTPALLRGFSTATYNKRGITSRGLTDGGAQEYALADRFEGWSTAVLATSPKTARILRDLAEGYRSEGRRNDEEAQRMNEGFPL